VFRFLIFPGDRFYSYRTFNKTLPRILLVTRRGIPVASCRTATECRGHVHPGAREWCVRLFWFLDPKNITDLAVGFAAKRSVADANNGVTFPFSGDQINQIYECYHHLKGQFSIGFFRCAHEPVFLELQRSGKNTIPAIGWLMGAVMPLDAVEKTCTDSDLEHLIGHMQF
jgi:hypothetical protein